MERGMARWQEGWQDDRMTKDGEENGYLQGQLDNFARRIQGNNKQGSTKRAQPSKDKINEQTQHEGMLES